MNIKLRNSFVAVLVLIGFAHGEPELEITNGKLRGKISESRDGRPYYSYTGVPYAKPPTGERRFKPPEPAEPWTGTFDATKQSNICAQQGFTGGQEDCLYLNVYSPKTNASSLPVMFWIHGGGFNWGHGRSDVYGPEYFMDKDVVLVTINYRLGLLGFLSAEDDAIPGNYGMKDQVQALRWVRENIVRFNGDPNRVTIFGGSAGAACAGFHMLSPMSKGLFHKAILQSGTPVCRWAALPAGIARKRAHSIATIAGCNYDTSEDILKCLRKLPAEHLMDLQNKLHSWLDYPYILFNPAVENCNHGKEAFLCHHPLFDFKQESFVPVVIGLNSAEGGLYVAPMYNGTSLVLTEFIPNFNRLMAVVSDYNFFTRPEHIDEIGEKLLKKYFPAERIGDHTHLNAVKLFMDAIFTQCAFDMAFKLSSPVYTYVYDHQNEFSFNKVFGSCEVPLGVTHGDELNSLFKLSSLNSKALNENDLQVSKLAVNIWYKFISSNKPTIDGAENGTAWPTFTQSNQVMLHLNSSPSLFQNPYSDNYEFWKNLPFDFKNNL